MKLDSSSRPHIQTDFFHELYFFIICLLIYFWICWVFIAVQGLFLLGVSGGCSLRCTGFSLKWLLLLWSIGSRCTAFSSCKRGPSCCSLWALECGLSICGTGGLVTLRHVESSWTRDQICVPCFGRWILVHCTTIREVPP